MEGLELRTGLLVGATVLLAAICSGSPVPKKHKAEAMPDQQNFFPGDYSNKGSDRQQLARIMAAFQ